MFEPLEKYHRRTQVGIEPTISGLLNRFDSYPSPPVIFFHSGLKHALNIRCLCWDKAKLCNIIKSTQPKIINWSVYRLGDYVKYSRPHAFEMYMYQLLKGAQIYKIARETAFHGGDMNCCVITLQDSTSNEMTHVT